VWDGGTVKRPRKVLGKIAPSAMDERTNQEVGGKQISPGKGRRTKAEGGQFRRASIGKRHKTTPELRVDGEKRGGGRN